MVFFRFLQIYNIFYIVEKLVFIVIDDVLKLLQIVVGVQLLEYFDLVELIVDLRVDRLLESVLVVVIRVFLFVIIVFKLVLILFKV